LQPSRVACLAPEVVAISRDFFDSHPRGCCDPFRPSAPRLLRPVDQRAMPLPSSIIMRLEEAERRVASARDRVNALEVDLSLAYDELEATVVLWFVPSRGVMSHGSRMT
jgi:hypothetical protein